VRINGQWVSPENGAVQPIVEVSLLDEVGTWHPVPFVVDTGAEVSVVRYQVFNDAPFELDESEGSALVGFGGSSSTAAIRTKLRLSRDDGQIVTISGIIHASTDPIGLDDNLLGRDVLSNFAVIVDRPANQVTLLAGNHRYQVVAS